MNDKDFESNIKRENSQINIEMSEKLKRTQIVISNNVEAKRNKKTSLLPKLVASFCCSLVLVAAVIGALILNNQDSALNLTAYIMEINPSICLVTDRDDKIINVCALNEDANSILSNEQLSDMAGMALDSCIGKVLDIVKCQGYFENSQNSIKLYAINDNERMRDKRLDNFEKIVQKSVQKLGVGEINLEKHEMAMGDFKEKLGFDEDFKKLDDMKDFLEKKDKHHISIPESQTEESPVDQNPSLDPSSEQIAQDLPSSEDNNITPASPTLPQSENSTR